MIINRRYYSYVRDVNYSGIKSFDLYFVIYLIYDCNAVYTCYSLDISLVLYHWLHVSLMRFKYVKKEINEK